MTYNHLKQRLDAGEVVIMDGGTGTELQRRGASMDPAAWCGPATLRSEKLLTEIHADFDGDTFMKPPGPEWQIMAREDFPAEDDAPAYSFVTLERAA